MELIAELLSEFSDPPQEKSVVFLFLQSRYCNQQMPFSPAVLFSYLLRPSDVFSEKCSVKPCRKDCGRRIHPVLPYDLLHTCRRCKHQIASVTEPSHIRRDHVLLYPFHGFLLHNCTLLIEPEARNVMEIVFISRMVCIDNRDSVFLSQPQGPRSHKHRMMYVDAVKSLSFKHLEYLCRINARVHHTVVHLFLL